MDYTKSQITLTMYHFTKTPQIGHKTLWTIHHQFKYHQKDPLIGVLIQFRHLSPVKYTHNKPCSRHHQNTYKFHKNPGLYITNFTQISTKTVFNTFKYFALPRFLIQFRHLSTVKYTLLKPGSRHHQNTTNSTKTLDYTSPISLKYHQKPTPFKPFNSNPI